VPGGKLPLIRARPSREDQPGPRPRTGGNLKKRHAAAARFYAAAFGDDPKLADEPRAGHRYNAACYAALAAASRGTDAPKPDAKERARLRGQALGWLRAGSAGGGLRLSLLLGLTLRGGGRPGG
jgi:hypothetical protein